MVWELATLEDEDFDGALVMVGMPSFGMVGQIAVRFLVEHLRMRPIGLMVSDTSPPTAVAWQGVLTGPVQLFASDMACGLDGRCDRLVVVNADVSIPMEEMMDLAGALVEWASEAKVGLLVGLEGYSPDSPATGIVGASNIAGEATLARLKAERLHGPIIGFNAAMLSQANVARLPAVGLFAQAGAQEGDARAAAELLRIVRALVPNIDVAPAQLEKQAEALETQLRDRHAEQARAAGRLEEQISKGYV